MSHFLTVELPGDLPENWTTDQYVAPEGADVGLSQQHGYNYLCQQINRAQTAGLTLSRVLCSGFENLVDNWYFEDPINTSGGYCVLKGTKYYRETSLSTLVNTTTAPLAANNVDGVYGTIVVGSTTYYVSYADMYEGYVTSGMLPIFNRWAGRGCVITRDKAGNGLVIEPSSTYGPATIQQAIADTARLKNKTVTLSVLVESVTGSPSIGLRTSETPDGLISTEIASMSLTAGINARNVTLSYGLGTGNAKYLFISIGVPVGASVKIRAIKLQLGTKQTLAYQDGNYYRFVEFPNRVVEHLRCIGAPVEIGGQGYLSSVTDIAPATVE